jgi:hypothetical protein
LDTASKLPNYFTKFENSSKLSKSIYKQKLVKEKHFFLVLGNFKCNFKFNFTEIRYFLRNIKVQASNLKKRWMPNLRRQTRQSAVCVNNFLHQLLGLI